MSDATMAHQEQEPGMSSGEILSARHQFRRHDRSAGVICAGQVAPADGKLAAAVGYNGRLAGKRGLNDFEIKPRLLLLSPVHASENQW